MVLRLVTAEARFVVLDILRAFAALWDCVDHQEGASRWPRMGGWGG